MLLFLILRLHSLLNFFMQLIINNSHLELLLQALRSSSFISRSLLLIITSTDLVILYTPSNLSIYVSNPPNFKSRISEFD